MKENLGPHTLHYISPEGLSGTITLNILPGAARRTDPGDGCFLDEVTGSIEIISDWFRKTISMHGLNDIQLVFRLLWTADIYVKKICHDNGYELYKYRPGDVRKAFDSYN